MTKQHFIAIAAQFKNNVEAAREENDPRASNAVECTIKGFCNVAEQFNPRFDRARFLKACGIN